MPLRAGPFVGRDTDLERLTTAAGLTPDGAPPGGGRVVLSGDAGIGKSRLVAEVTERATSHGWRAATGHCVGQAGSELAYLPFVELVGLLVADAPDVGERVLATHATLAHLLPGRTPDPVGDAGAATDPGIVAESVHALLTAMGADRPTLVVVEDVHWADHSSRDLLTLLLTRGFTTAVALVVTYRSDDLHRRHPLHETLAVWARIAGVGHLELAPLTDADIGDLVTGLARTPHAQDLPEITRRAAGNPFFAEELAASAATGQVVSGGLERVLQSRVEQLDETTQQVVRAVAVAGRQVRHDLLARVVELPDAQLERAIAEAVEHHVLETCWPPAYTFRHALLGETVAAALLPGERLRLHRAYAAALAGSPDLAPAAELASELARHAAASGDLGTAVAASRSAAESALSVGGPLDALHHLERALGWLDEDDPARDAVSLRAAVAAMRAGDLLRSVGLLKDRLDHPGRAQTPARRAELLAAYATRSRILDLPVDGLALTEEALTLLPPDRDARRVTVLTAHLQQLVDHERHREAVALGDELTALTEELRLPRVLVEVRTILTRVIEAQHDLDAAEAVLTTVRDEAVRTGDPIQLRIHHQLGSLSHRRGDLTTALDRFDAGAEAARRLGREWAPWGLECRLLGGLTAYELGDWALAAQRLDVSGESVPQPGRSLFDAAALILLAGRGQAVDEERITALREWWSVDGFCAILTLQGATDLLGDRGDIGAMLDLTTRGIDLIDQTWGPFQAVIRIVALVVGQVAGAPPADPVTRERWVEASESLVGRASATLALVVDAASADPANGEVGVDALRPRSRETWAWALRLEAEALRLRHAFGLPGAPTAAELVEAWTRSVAAFEAYGHVFEGARSTTRLAVARHLAGDRAGALDAAGRARTVARRLGATPLLRELDGAGLGSPSSTGAALTPRELEVLRLVARGLSNGQVGRQLFISTKTVSVHVSNILAKLGAASRTEAVAVATARALLD